MLRRIRIGRSALSSSAIRSIVVTSQQSPVLTNNQKHRGFKSNLWVEEENDEYWYRGFTRVKKGEISTVLPIQKRFEVYNLDQLDGEFPAPPISNLDKELNYNKSIPFNQIQQEVLQRIRRQRNFASQYWISKSYIGRKGHPLKDVKIRDRERGTTLFYEISSRMLNADQFENPDLVRLSPIAGGSGAGYRASSNAATILRADANHRGFATGIYYTQRQLDALKLEKAEGATGVEINFNEIVTKDSRAFFIYNLDDVIDGDAWCAKLQRFPVDTPTFLLQARHLGETAIERVLPFKDKFKSNYFVSNRDLEFAGQRLKPKATAIYVGKKIPATRLYNVEELQHPIRGYELVGTYTV